jgi:hypothetical protein
MVRSFLDVIVVVALLVGMMVSGAQRAGAEPILSVIDIRPIVDQHDIGNALGVAYNPAADVIYLAHGSDSRGGFIYTLDMHGNLLNEFDLQSAYQPGAFPESLSYDRSSGHLFVVAPVPVDEGFISHLLEIDPHTANILRDLPIDTNGGGGIHVRGDGIWQARFSEDIIRHYTPDLVFIEDVSVAGSFPGFPGPIALTSSFMGGFFIVDHFGRRLVEVDPAGNEVAAVSTANLGDGRGLAIDADSKTQRMFLQVNNEEIYVLSSEFIGVSPELVSIDIKPGSDPNRINPKSHGKVPVAILTTERFDATTVDPRSVRFGPKGAKATPKKGQMKDVNHDGAPDLVLPFRTQATGIQCGETSASLTGETYGGNPIQGTDAIKTVGCEQAPVYSQVGRLTSAPE